MISGWITGIARAAALSAGLFIAFLVAGHGQQLAPLEPAGPEAQERGSATGAPSTLSTSNGPDCANRPEDEARAAVFVPPEPPASNRRARPKKQEHASEGRSVLSGDPTPAVQPETAVCTLKAAERYRRIAEDGGWPVIPRPFRQDTAAVEDVNRLRQRLSIEGDLLQKDAPGEGWDDALTAALKSFQRRAGLQQSAEADKATLKALNVPAGLRAHQLEATAKRIAEVNFPFDQPYVVVNIPSASVEAVNESRVVQRHAAIAGKVDHPSPQLTAAIQGITINPAWTIPRSIIENELIPKLSSALWIFMRRSRALL